MIKEPVLIAKNLGITFGGLKAVSNFNLDINQGELVGLIGPNGAGKTTILHTITGLKGSSSGEISYNDNNLIKIDPSNIVTLGIAHVPEGRHIFSEMTVEENLKMGAFTRKDKGKAELDIYDVYKRFPRLKERSKQTAGTLSGGEQQMLAMGRALMSAPKIMLMDEPSMGLSPLLVKEIFNIIRELHNAGITILLVEQNAKMALSIADRAYVLETGHISMKGPAKDLLEDDRVRKAYLGA